MWGLTPVVGAQILRNNTFRHVHMQTGESDDGSGVWTGGNPIITAVYFDAAMSGWIVQVCLEPSWLVNCRRFAYYF